MSSRKHNLVDMNNTLPLKKGIIHYICMTVVRIVDTTYSSKGEFIAGMLLNKRKKKMNVHMKNLCETPNNK